MFDIYFMILNLINWTFIIWKDYPKQVKFIYSTLSMDIKWMNRHGDLACNFSEKTLYCSCFKVNLANFFEKS